MASKAFYPCAVTIFLSLLLLPLLSHGDSSDHPQQHEEEESSAFDFIKNLEGSRKGDNVQGIYDLKLYLHKFGYLHATLSSHKKDLFDEELESAVKTYQLNYNLKPTGILDIETVSQMMEPRCGTADVTNGTTRMRSGLERQFKQFFHTTAHYAFFPGYPTWPRSKYHLTYKFEQGTPREAVEAVDRAFSSWARNTRFKFSRVKSRPQSDIIIGFHRGNHGDGTAFDGRGGTLAHAFAPMDGRFHYDGDDRWGVGGAAGAFDLETVALHEIGHLLGLHHSSVKEAIMYPSISRGLRKGLHADDIEGIKVLYNNYV